eukprot:scaffold34609_cov146-Amphora_coffeaeformis.AAC.19
MRRPFRRPLRRNAPRCTIRGVILGAICLSPWWQSFVWTQQQQLMTNPPLSLETKNNQKTPAFPRPALNTDNNNNNNNNTAVIVTSSCPCISEYLTRLRRLGIQNTNVSYQEWEAVLCPPPPVVASSSSSSSTTTTTTTMSDRPLILGAGPGTSATRSFALAVGLLGKSVLHYNRARMPFERNGPWKQQMEQRVRGVVNVLIRGLREKPAWQSAANQADFISLFDSIDAVFDAPFSFYTLDILRVFPKARLIMTHRDPEVWYERRNAFCHENIRGKCSPFLLRPLGIDIQESLTKEQVVGGFEATEHVLECVVGPDRFLRVDAWSPPPPPDDGDWLATLARFLNVPLPDKEESHCSVPRSTGHGLECLDEDCKKCEQWVFQNGQQHYSSSL